MEDNEDLLGYLISEMSPHFSLLWARNGQDALIQVERKKIDLIISDIMMPEMDGWTLYEELRENESARFIPFLFLTARASFEEKLKALGRGVSDYLEKPFSSEELIVRVKGIIERGIKYKHRYKQRLKESLIEFVEDFDEQGNIRDNHGDSDIGKVHLDLSLLSPREREVCEGILQGFSDKKIAHDLGISVKTVGNHNSSLFKKLDVSGRMELIIAARQGGAKK